MGALDSAEVCELCGLFLLWKMGRVIPGSQVGLYRDDGMSAVKGNGQEIERIRKKLIAMFKNEGLNITTEGNVTVVDFLDVVLDLDTGTYKPFIRPNANTMYVLPYSNHPPSITKNIPEAIRERLSSISSSKEMFESEVNHYQNALNEAGYEYLLEYKEADASDNKGKKKRRRNVIWFNPPFSKNVKTNLGAKFLSLIRKHFPKGSEFYKLFNSKKVKLAYSCCPSMKQIISRHNNKVLRRTRWLQLSRRCGGMSVSWKLSYRQYSL